MNKNISKLGESGFTLMEVVIAMGVGAIVMASILSLFSWSYKGQKDLILQNDKNTLIATLVSSIANSAVCSVVFSGSPTNPNVFTPSLDPGKTPLVPGAATPISIKIITEDAYFSQGNEYNGWNFVTLSFQDLGYNATPVGANSKMYIAEFKIRLEKTNLARLSSSGNPVFEKKMSLNMIVDNATNNILGCFDAASADSAVIRSCASLGGELVNSQCLFTLNGTKYDLTQYIMHLLPPPPANVCPLGQKQIPAGSGPCFSPGQIAGSGTETLAYSVTNSTGCSASPPGATCDNSNFIVCAPGTTKINVWPIMMQLAPWIGLWFFGCQVN